MMLFKSIILVCLCAVLSNGVIHDYYTGKVASKNLLKFYETNNLTSTCTTDVEPCDKDEWSRVDGSCNNLQNPARGSFFSPIERILPAQYYDGYKPRKAISGDDLPLERVVRLALLNQGDSSHLVFNHNVPGYAIYKFNDIGTTHDIENFLLQTTYCCEKEHMNDYACTPNIIQDDDPVFRFSSIRCMNSTRPLTYQHFNCTKEKIPSPIKRATTTYDESSIYNFFNEGDKVIRSFKNGMLIVEKEDGQLFPPNGPNVCLNNIAPDETRCFKNHINGLLPVTLYIIWFVRHHNYIASNLAKVNPSWDDDMLFNVARDINIAYGNQLYFFQWNEAVQGKQNLLKQGILTPDNGFRDLYDEQQYPQVTLEYSYCMRWFHLMQERTAKLHDRHGNFIKDYPLFNATFRTGLTTKNMEAFTQSTFRAPCHAVDGSISPDIANRGFPGVQEALDITAGDLNKGRNFGLAPYIDYIYHFFGVKITSFKDLEEFIPKKYIEILKTLYQDVRNIDLLAGLWCEKFIEGGHIPRLLAAILNDNFFRAVKSDRHWFERPNRPHAFTAAQLKEIRKASLSLLLCNVGDGVSKIPKNAFLKITDKNPLVPCSKIQKMNFSVWAENI